MADADIYRTQMTYAAQELARRSAWKIKFDGVDITREITADMLSVDITDNASESSDDLQIKLADADGKWVKRWLTETIYAGAKLRGLKIEVWTGVRHGEKIVQQKAGTFLLDSVKAGGPPAQVTIKATSLPMTGGIRDEKRDKAWENISLEGIAGEIAQKAGLSLVYDAPTVSYERREQNDMADLAFLRALCREAGLCLKICDMQMVLFSTAAYAKQASVLKIRFGDGQYTKWSLETGSKDIAYDSCIVRYAHPEKGLIEGSATSEKYEDNEDHNQLVITNRRVESSGEAQEIAAEELRLKNEFGETATFTMPGNPGIMAGMNVDLEDFGYWSGKHPIKYAKHKLSASGYTTEIKLGGDLSHHTGNGVDDYTLGSGQIIRLGRVVDVNGDKTKARVKFLSQGLVSDWLYVAQFPEWGNVAGKMNSNSASHKHHIAEKWGAIKDSFGGALQGDETDPDGAHSHRIQWIQWFPRINDLAICIFPTGSDSHGYIVGCV